jgi:ubiquinone/menaquinone biosynthesis C-methylase UbiE
MKGRVLEIGCGTGLLFEHYLDQAQVTAIDPDEEFLSLAAERAREASAEVRLLAGDAQQLSFADDGFDGAVMHLVLCTVPDARRGLAEILRVVRPGGLLYFYEHVISPKAWYAAIQNLSAPVVCWIGEGCHWNRDTGALVRSMPVAIDREDRSTLRIGLMPPLPIVRIIARNQ